LTKLRLVFVTQLAYNEQLDLNVKIMKRNNVSQRKSPECKNMRVRMVQLKVVLCIQL